MSIEPKRRALIASTLLCPAVWTGSLVAPMPQEHSVDLIRRLMEEVLTSPEQREAEARLRQDR